MKTKQEQIDEIEITVRHNCNKQGIAKHCPERISNGIYSAGYRKASDVAEEIRDKIEAQGRFEFCGYDGKEYLTIQTDKFNEIIKTYKFAAKMRQEVKK